MTNNDKHTTVLNALRKVYPGAMSYIELWDLITVGVPPADRLNKRGGNLFRTLLKQGKVAKVTTGYYAYVPH
jgi:hypothetical protein